MKKWILIALTICISITSLSQPNSTAYKYLFLIQDSPSRLFSMRQFNQGYLSGYRLMARELNQRFEDDRISPLIQLGLLSFFLLPLSHEEGHRSILTGKKIGSISRPFFNKKGAAYVIGVTDETLINLRDTDLPNYIRLHSAGLESDYMLTSRSEDLIAFDMESFDNLKYEYWIRKYGILQYFLTGLFSFEPDISEESDELDRDIVGYDTYGAARHLHRPGMAFHRYTTFEELTAEERKFVTRMGWRSLLNVLNPVIIGRNNFQLTKSLKANFGMGYMLAPFGDFIDENIWLVIKDKIRLKVYFRQFQNRSTWSFGSGVGIYDLRLFDQMFLSSKAHFWQQPKALYFNTTESETGGAFELDLSYFFLSKNKNRYRGTSIDIGTTMKTTGFLPEELYLNRNIGVRIGTSFWF